jgi:hypothetical protein
MYQGKAEEIRNTFNEVIHGGGAVRLSQNNEPDEEVVPTVPEGTIEGRYYRVRDGVNSAFRSSRYSDIKKLGIVQKTKVVDQNGNEVHGLPANLDGYRLVFEVWGMPKGDEYRVEVWPDEDHEIPHDVEQIPAGTHVEYVQNYDVPLKGNGATGYSISVHKVDKETAKRDSNEESPSLWRKRYAVV